MSDLNLLLLTLNKVNISKVDLANYLNVSRQMVYNYLSMDSFDEWPIKKRIRILELFDVKNYDELETLNVDTELLNSINVKLKTDGASEIFESYNSLDNKSKQMVHDVVKLCEEEQTKSYINVVLTLIEHALISKDYKYLITYLSKIFEKEDPTIFGDDKNSQMAFEGILYSAFNLFNSNKYSRDKTAKVHEQFVKEIKNKSKDDMQKTNSLNLTKMIAKNELGIDKIDDSNIDQVLEKILEIQGRKL